MTTIKRVFKKKGVRLLASILIFALYLYLGTFIPQFASATKEVQDNCLTVHRENMSEISMKVDVIRIDAKGNVAEETVEVLFEDDVTDFSYDQEYFKNVLGTEDDVYIIGVADGLFNVIGSYSTGVSIALTIYAIIAFVLMWCILLSLFAILP